MLSKRHRIYQTGSSSLSSESPQASSFAQKSYFSPMSSLNGLHPIHTFQVHQQLQQAAARRPAHLSFTPGSPTHHPGQPSQPTQPSSPRRRCESSLFLRPGKPATTSTTAATQPSQPHEDGPVIRPLHVRNRTNRPKMGIPAVVTRPATSTPTPTASTATTSSGAERDKEEEDQEPIYCEIVTPGKGTLALGGQTKKPQGQMAQATRTDLRSPACVRASHASHPSPVCMASPERGGGSRAASFPFPSITTSSPREARPGGRRLQPADATLYEGRLAGVPQKDAAGGFFYRHASSESGSRFGRPAGGDLGKPPPGGSWAQRYRAGDSQIRNVFRGNVEGVGAPSSKASPAPPGLGRRAATQLEIPLNRRKEAEPSASCRRCPENPSGLDLVPLTFERHRWERHSVNSEATSVSLASYGGGADDADFPLEARATLLKGVMWLQREKVFSRWKERFFVLTKDYLQCFKKSTSMITEMGGFVFRVRLCEIEELELIVRRGYLTISLSTPKTGKLLLRKPDGIRRWYQVIQECVATCKEKQEAEREKNKFLMRKQLTDSSSMEAWLQAKKQAQNQGYSNWIETGSCISETLTGTLISNLDNHSLESTDYGFIDGPTRRMIQYQRGTSSRGLNFELKSIDDRLPSNCHSPSSAVLVRKAMTKQSDALSSISTTFSRDSGIDSMNAANSPEDSPTPRAKSPLPPSTSLTT